jgi:hypothetical protein
MILNGSMRGRSFLRATAAACFLLAAASHEAAAETRSLTDRDDTGWQEVLLDRVKREADLSVPIADLRLLETLRFAVYDCWKPKPGASTKGSVASGREYYPSCSQIEPRRSEVAWLLVRYEWDTYRRSVERAKQEEAAWSLQESIAEYRRVVRESAEPLGQKLNRLRVALGYAAAAEEQLSEGGPAGIAESETTLRKAVREEINAVLALDKFGDKTMQSIAGPIVNMIRDVMATYLRAVDAEAVARSLAVTVYGSGAALDASKEALATTEEREKLDPANITDADLRSWVVQATRARSEAIGIVQRYAELKMNLWGGPQGQNSHAGNLEIRTKTGPVNLLRVDEVADKCENDRAKVAQQIDKQELPKDTPLPACDRRADLRRALGPAAFDQLFHQHAGEQQVQQLLFQVAEVACKPAGAPIAGRTCDLLREKLSAANAGRPDLKKSIDDLSIVSHLPYFADMDPLQSEKEGQEQKMLYGRLAKALADDNATAKVNVLNDRIDALERAFAGQRVVNGVALDLGAAKDAARVRALDADVQSVCRVVAAIDESLVRSGLRQLDIPACAQTRASR